MEDVFSIPRLLSTLPFGVVVAEQQQDGGFNILAHNACAALILGEDVSPAKLGENEQICGMLANALAKGGEELRVDVLGVASSAFLARLFALSERHVCVHLHDPEHPLVVMNSGSEVPMPPPMLSVHAAADLVSSYHSNRKRGDPLDSRHHSKGSLEYMVSSSSGPALEIYRSRASIYDDLAVPVGQWTEVGDCMTANSAILSFTGQPDATAMDLPRFLTEESAERTKSMFRSLDSGGRSHLMLEMANGTSVRMNVSQSVTTGLYVGVLVPAVESDVLDKSMPSTREDEGSRRGSLEPYIKREDI